MIISYAQNFEDVMLWRALQHIDKGFYIDVGANDPVVDSVTQLFYEHGWCGINIEPVALHWNALQNDRPRDINLNCAAGKFEGEIKIWECSVRGWASADEEVIAGHIANGHSGQYIAVPQTTLNHVWSQYVKSEVHFLKIDVEGFERSVFEGLDFQQFRPWIVVVEATHPNTTREIYKQWEPLLLVNDYIFVYADGLNRFYVAGERSELTAAFKHPPNFFDYFVKAPQIEGNLWAEIISTRADKARALATAANAQTEHAEARTKTALVQLAQAEVRIDSLLKSTCWRITLPVRIVGNALKRVFGLDTHLATLPVRIFDNCLKRFKLNKIQAQVLNLHNNLRQNWTELARLPKSIKGQASNKRLRLAFVSPLPPAYSGIADYSAELLTALEKFYDIDVILEQSSQTLEWIERKYGVRDSNWLLQNSNHYDRVLYHFGNSNHHQHMLHLLTQVPGIVVLHDFYLGDLLNHLEANEVDTFACQRGLYQSHGYDVLAKRFVPGQRSVVTEQYPANFEVLQLALGVYSGSAF